MAMLHRAANLAQLDQKEMLNMREAWFEEVGGPPTGNKRELNLLMTCGDALTQAGGGITRLRLSDQVQFHFSTAHLMQWL